MKLERAKLKRDIIALYEREHEELGETGTLEMLDRARQWNLAPTLEAGGVLVFPHAGVQDCGHQIAAVVNACLDSGADRVLVVSVLHAFNNAMEEARVRVANGADPAKEPYRGIQGPGIDFPNSSWPYDHVLMSWRHFWKAETERRGIQGPEVIERFPYLAGGRPGELPGIDELARIAEDAVIVSTADAFHHGLGYGTPPEQTYAPDEEGLAVALNTMEEGIQLLGRGDYWGYNEHCVRAKSDARDAGQVFRYLRGPMQGEIIDLTYTDASELYRQPRPTWVAGALFEWKLVPNGSNGHKK